MKGFIDRAGSYFLLSLLLLGFNWSFAKTEKDDSVNQGGTLTFALNLEPVTLHPLLHMDAASALINSYMCDSLLGHESKDNSWKGALAQKWSVSDDGKVFTFHLRDKIVFHDGVPITADDVKFTFETVKNKDYEGLVPHLKPYFQGIERIELEGLRTVKFYTKDSYFKNFFVAASFGILPKHIYGDIVKSKKMNHDVICSGPYRLDKYQFGQKVSLIRFKDWYGYSLEAYKGYYNFDKIDFKVYSNEAMRLQALLSGEIDFMSLSAEDYGRLSTHSKLGKDFELYKSDNQLKPSFSFITWNNQDDRFKSPAIRKAMSQVLNREWMNKQFRMGLSDLPATPVPSHLEVAPKAIKPSKFDPIRALEILKKEGWSDSDQDSVLDKKINEKIIKLEFKMLYGDDRLERYLTLYQGDLRKIGIIMSLEKLEWTTFVQKVSTGQYQAAAMSWAFFDNEPDPQAMWHSNSRGQGGSNFSNYSNLRVDALIDKARLTTSRSQRISLMQEIYRDIGKDEPISLLFSDSESYYALKPRIQKPTKPGPFELPFRLWWASDGTNRH